MSGFTKLHSSIAMSSLMALPVASRWIWTFMLSQVDADGVLEGSVSGLAIAANVTLEECQAAIDVFLAPDPYSRTKDQEGRRIVEVDGGWQIVSYRKHRFKLSADERKAYKAAKQQEYRDRDAKSRAEARAVTRDVVSTMRGRNVDR